MKPPPTTTLLSILASTLAAACASAPFRPTTIARGDTSFRVGSISNLATAMAVMKLVDIGQVDLDAPITDYLPDFSIRSIRISPGSNSGYRRCKERK